jgi:hypothetical protein
MAPTIRLIDPGDARPSALRVTIKAQKTPICAPGKLGIIRLRLTPRREKCLN